MKFNLLTEFNKLQTNFVEERSNDSKFDLGIACDLLLDLIRYHTEIILDSN